MYSTHSLVSNRKQWFPTFQELPNDLTHWEEWVVLPTSYLQDRNTYFGCRKYRLLEPYGCVPATTIPGIMCTLNLLCLCYCLSGMLSPFPMPQDMSPVLKDYVGVSSPSEEDCCFVLSPGHLPQCVPTEAVSVCYLMATLPHSVLPYIQAGPRSLPPEVCSELTLVDIQRMFE